jgi:hypothetical protein
MFFGAISTSDFHQWMADKVFNCDRGTAKKINFAMSYGAGAETLSGELRVSLEQAQRWISQFDAMFPDLKQWKASLVQRAITDGYIVNPFGRVVWVEKGKERTQAVSYFCQSGIADFMEWVITACWTILKPTLLFTIYDSFVLKDISAVPALKEAIANAPHGFNRIAWGTLEPKEIGRS